MVVGAFLAGYDDVLRAADVTSPSDEVLQREPEPRALVAEGEADSMVQVFADFVDLKSPYTAGHSREVAELVALADREHSAAFRRAALVHDIGRMAVPNGIWEKPGRSPTASGSVSASILTTASASGTSRSASAVGDPRGAASRASRRIRVSPRQRSQ